MARNILASVSGSANGNLYGYQLPKGLVPITIIKEDGIFRFEVGEVAIVPDPDQQYFFKYQPSPFTSDELNIQFSSEGFLSSLKIAVDDQTGEFISKVVDVGSAIASVVGGPGVGTRSLGQADEGPQEIFSGTIDPFDENQMTGINQLLAKHGTGVTLEAKVLGKRQISASDTIGESVSGVYCRPLASCEITLIQGKSRTAQVIRMPNPEVLHFVEIPQAAWVKTEVDIQFNELGYPLSIHILKPSSALAMIQVPLDIIQAIIELPTKLFQFRINLGSQRADALQAQVENEQRMEALKNQVRELQAQQEESATAQSRSVGGGEGQLASATRSIGAGVSTGIGDPELVLKLQERLDVLTKRDEKRRKEIEALRAGAGNGGEG